MRECLAKCDDSGVEMTAADDRFLEFLRNIGNEELIAVPEMIELNIDYGKILISNRLGTLGRWINGI